MIKLVEITKIYRTSEIETKALENINLEVREGEFVSIMDLPDAENPHCSTSRDCSTNLRPGRWSCTGSLYPASMPGNPPVSATANSDLSSRVST